MSIPWMTLLTILFVRNSVQADEFLALPQSSFQPVKNCSMTSRPDLKLSLFPKDFVWGIGTSAGQVEGGALIDGRTPSGWDLFSRIPGKIIDASNASVACDSYHLYEEDVRAVESLNMKSYRFSLSWSRIFPHGGSETNPKGVQYYNNLIDALLAKDIEPLVTIHHLDLPIDVDHQGGWLNKSIVQRYADYAEGCFKLFGDRVKKWATLNEPYHMAVFEYSNGEWPPARCSDRTRCAEGNGPVETYQAMHNMLLAHAKIVKTYRTKYQGKTGGQIGINVEGPFFYPLNQEAETLAATERAFTWRFLWAWEPVYSGDYPALMRDRLGSRLPYFTEEEKELLKGSVDYFGLNFYTGTYVMNLPPSNSSNGYDAVVETDAQYKSVFYNEDGEFIGKPTGFFFRPEVPGALYHLLMWLTERYPGMPIVIAENGFASNPPVPPVVKGANEVAEEPDLCDAARATFYQNYLANALKAILEGANVKGFYIWSLLDSFEWAYGYTVLHGLQYVDFNDSKRKRYPRASYYWWSSFLRGELEEISVS